MDFLKRLFGGGRDDGASEAATGDDRQANAARASGGQSEALSADEQAIERYRYLLRTAPPETLEEAHAEAFAQLTPEQRQIVVQELTREVPERELAGAADDPRALARAATRAELRRPGTLERTFSNPAMGAGGIGMGGLLAGSFLSTIAGVVVGSAVADAFFSDSGASDAAAAGDESGADAGASGDGGDTGDTGDTGFGGADYDASTLGADIGDPGADIGGDVGTDIGGDFGSDFGGDFGGGEF